MHLTLREQERLLITVAAEVARRRRARGLRLNHPEAVALLTEFVLEGARDGRSVAELMAAGRTVLGPEDVMEGVAELVGEVQVEATFPDGTKLVTIHQPIAATGGLRPGEILHDDDLVPAVPDRELRTLRVENTGDRPIQVGSHFHLAEANPALELDREAAWGRRLAVPAGTSVRFEPGVAREVATVPIGGTRTVLGLRGDCGGALDGGLR